MKNLLAILMTLTMFIGCVAFAEADAGAYGILVPNITTNNFYASCIEGVKQGLTDVDPNAEQIIAQCDNDAAVQLDQMADMVQRGVKCIILIPWGSSTQLAGIQEAAEAGIPVCCLDTAPSDLTYVASTIVSDNYSAGNIAGLALVEALPEGGKVVSIETTGSEAINARMAGFNDAIAGSGLEIIQHLILNEGTVEEAMVQMENALQAIPDLAGVFATGDVFADAAASAMMANGYNAGDIKIVSVDGNAKGCELVEEGWAYCTAAQQTILMGYQTAEAAVKVLKGEEVEQYVELPCLKVTKEVLKAGEYIPY